MSKYSPIIISDTEQSDNEDKEERRTDVFVISDDENTNMDDSFKAGKFDTARDFAANASAQNLLTIKRECKKTTTIPKSPISLNKEKLQWLSCRIKLDKTKHGNAGVESVKNEADCQLDNDQDIGSPALDRSQASKHKNDKEMQSSNTEQKLSYPEKNETTSSRLFESPSKKSSLALKCPKTETKSPSKTLGTPKKKTSLERFINSPRKVGAFGSPEKALKQMTLSKDSFSPKKLMTGPKDMIEDNSTHVPPLHATQINGYGIALQCNQPVLSFMDSQVDFLEGIKEEELLDSYVESLLGLVTVSRKPSPELCFSLVRELLLMSHSHSLSTRTYNALKRIQAIHPVVPEQMGRKLSFDFLEEIVERLEMTGCTCKHQVQSSLCLKANNALNTLTFLLDVMESEVQRKQFSPRKTIAFRLVSLQRNPGHIVKMLSWLSTAIELFCNYNSSNNSPNYLSILDLFQRLIQLSISTSEDPDHCAGQLAEELITTYSQLPSLECRTLLLQSLSSHLVRGKFLSLYVKVFCEKAEKSHGEQEFTGIKQIVQNDFECLPLRRDDDVDELTTRRCVGFHRSDTECEEHAMILAYSLQSYLFCHHKKLQRTAKRLMLDYHGLEETQELPNRRHLSMVDEGELVNMGDKVQIFAARIFSLCPSLTTRTDQLVGVLSNMKMWDTW